MACRWIEHITFKIWYESNHLCGDSENFLLLLPRLSADSSVIANVGGHSSVVNERIFLYLYRKQDLSTFLMILH